VISMFRLGLQGGAYRGSRTQSGKVVLRRFGVKRNGLGISTISPRLKLSRNRTAIIPRREARMKDLPSQMKRLDCSETARTSISHILHLVVLL